MAKGFTVKAAAPKKKAEDWDIAAIKERMRGKQIVFCLPGRGCSFTFEELCTTVLLIWYRMVWVFRLVKIILSMVWDGKLNYDYQLWIVMILYSTVRSFGTV